jgi:hypothetical protein
MRRRSTVLLVALGLVLGACGGDDKSKQAEIDAAVAKALASTTTQAPTTTAPGATPTTAAPAPASATAAKPVAAPKTAPVIDTKLAENMLNGMGRPTSADCPQCRTDYFTSQPTAPCDFLTPSGVNKGLPTGTQTSEKDCAAVGGTYHKESETQPSGSPTTQRPSATSPSTAPPTAPKTAVWTKVASFNGTGSKNGTVFQLLGGQQRLSWTCSMPTSGYTGSSGFYVESNESSTFTEGSFDCNTEAGHPSNSGETLLYMNHAGPYHFKVLATPNNTWTVTIEELR